MSSGSPRRAHPLLWIPTLYFAEGLPNVAVSIVAAVMFKNLGLTNEQIALSTGGMYLPWVLKPLWAPLIELYRTKRFFVLVTECLIAGTFAAIAMALRLPQWLAVTTALLWLMAFTSATQDIAADGVYIASTTTKEQGAYAGVQGVFWNIAKILASGALLYAIGYLHDTRQWSWQASWTAIMFVLAVVMVLTTLWHFRVLPPGDAAAGEPSSVASAMSTLLDSWVSFFRKPSIWMMLTVVFFYRFGEGFIEKMGPLFLLDPRASGGLGLDDSSLGLINGIGTFGFLAGTFGGGLLATRYGLKRVFLPLAFALNVPHITFFILSQSLPTDMWLITLLVVVEKIGYGLGTVGMILYMIQQLSPGSYRTAHYAFATGVMALCMMSTGMLSGTVQRLLGHQHFFLFVLVASIPPIILAAKAPFVTPDDSSPKAVGGGH
jgi:PAT family beta-lactamase induction signal transducer AmpG